MDLPFRKILPRSMIALLLVAAVSLASEQGNPSISGDYVCAYGCRVTDAAPSVLIDGTAATCTNELGGIYHGKALSDHSIYCFNKTGVLLKDGKTIQWDDGVIWKRLSRP
jgi:hypothetical protein